MDTYIVKRGDTLGKIAKQYSVSLQELLEINPQIENPDMIFPGQPINVPRPQGDDLGDQYQWFEIAKREIGVKEVPGILDNPRIIEYHATTTLRATDDEVSWCSSFVNWCMEQAGYQGTKSAAAKSWLRWRGGQEIDQARSGCVIIFDRGTEPWQGHVGFYVGEHGTEHVYVLGGNQSNQVQISSYRKRKIVGYRWPKDSTA